MLEGPWVLAATISAQGTAAMPVSTATRGPAGGHGHSSLPRRAGCDAESRLEVIYDRIIRSSHTQGDSTARDGGKRVGRKGEHEYGDAWRGTRGVTRERGDGRKGGAGHGALGGREEVQGAWRGRGKTRGKRAVKGRL